MVLAIHNWMKVEPLETTLARIARLGYSAIEIQGTPEKYDTKEVRRLLQKYDLRCWGSVTLMLEERNLLASDEAQRARSVDYMKSCVTMVAELGGEVLSAVPGTVGKIVPDATPDEEWRWAVESMKEVYDHAQRHGVRIAIEPINRFETYFINRSEQALALAEAVGPDCGICADVFHMNIEEADTFDSLRKAGRRIANVHVADNNRLAPGMGTLDWPRLLEAVRATGYDGAISVEFSPPIDRTPANPFPDAVDENPEHVSPEEKKFLEDHGSSVISESFYTMLTERSAQTLTPLL